MQQLGNNSGIEYIRESIQKLQDGGFIIPKASSGIKIKKSHEGLFTKKANHAGMSVQEYARKVLANKGGYDSSTVKQANFARNASKWH